MQFHTYREISERFGLSMDPRGIRFGEKNGQTMLMFTVSENKQVNTYTDRWVDGSCEFMYDGCKAAATNEKVCEYFRSHGNYAPIVMGVGLRRYKLDDHKYAGSSLEWVLFEEGLYIKDIRHVDGKIKFIIKIERPHIIRDLSYITRRWGSELRVPLPQLATSPIQVNDDTDDEYDFMNRFNRLSADDKEKFHKVIELPFVQDLLRLHVPGYF